LLKLQERRLKDMFYAERGERGRELERERGI
jgi:hypothetical protein